MTRHYCTQCEECQGCDGGARLLPQRWSVHLEPSGRLRARCLDCAGRGYICPGSVPTPPRHGAGAPGEPTPPAAVAGAD